VFVLGQWRAEIALAGFASQVGWLAYNVVALGMLAAIRHMRFFTKAVPGVELSREGSLAVAYLAPLFVTLAAMMSTRALSSGFDWLYPARVVAAAAVLWIFWREYGAWQWKWSWPAVGLGGVAFAGWMVVELAVSDSAAHVSPWSPEAGLGSGGAVVWVMFRILGAVVTVPLAEELAFRGYLTRRLIAADIREVPPGQFSWFSFLFSSVLFGALHSWLLAGTVVGMLYALALYRRGRVADAVLAHAVTNALIAAYVLVTGRWSLWG